MNDDPTSGAPQRDDSTQPAQDATAPERAVPAEGTVPPAMSRPDETGSLDETQPVEVPRYAPTPDPRPDARWAWAAPSGQPTSDRWYEPAPAEPGRASGPSWGQPAWTSPVAETAPVTPAPSTSKRSGPGIGTVIAASLLSAVVASGGTVIALERAGAFDHPVPTASVGSVNTVGSPQPVSINENSAVIDVAAKLSPAVVKITTDTTGNGSGAGGTTDPFSNGVPSEEGVGSGFIYDSNGWILTNRHVVTGADKLTVELKDGRQFQGKTYGIDTLTDLAIVKIDATGLPVASLGESDGLKIGQLVVAIGSPLGTYSFSVTSGIVSGKGRTIEVDNGTRINNLIQTDAAINPGNSGGPLADSEGNVVGINTAVATDSSGIGFAIPIDIAKPIMAQAVAGKSLTRPWIGIRFLGIDQQTKDQFNLPVDQGAYVSNNGGNAPAVQPDSPAAKAGIQDGDIIQSINGITIDTEHPLDALLVQFAPGDVVKLQVLRDGKTVTVDVTLGTRPNA
jgi:S1-C subfamily serine protease